MVGKIAAAVAVVAVACPTFRRRIRSNCRLSGEDTYYRLGMEERRAVNRPWTPKGRYSAPEYDQSVQGDNEPHVIQ